MQNTGQWNSKYATLLLIFFRYKYYTHVISTIIILVKKKIFRNFNIHTSIKPAWLTNITITQLVTCIGNIYNEKLCMNMSVTYNKSWKYVKILVSQTFTCFRIQTIKGLQLEVNESYVCPLLYREIYLECTQFIWWLTICTM